MKEIFVTKGIPVVPSLGEIFAAHNTPACLNNFMIIAPGNNDVWRKLPPLLYAL